MSTSNAEGLDLAIEKLRECKENEQIDAWFTEYVLDQGLIEHLSGRSVNLENLESIHQACSPAQLEQFYSNIYGMIISYFEQIQDYHSSDRDSINRETLEEQGARMTMLSKFLITNGTDEVFFDNIKEEINQPIEFLMNNRLLSSEDNQWWSEKISQYMSRQNNPSQAVEGDDRRRRRHSMR